jgi:hypothetical protein
MAKKVTEPNNVVEATEPTTSNGVTVTATCTFIQKSCIEGEVKNIGVVFSSEAGEFLVSSPDVLGAFEEGTAYRFSIEAV